MSVHLGALNADETPATRLCDVCSYCCVAKKRLYLPQETQQLCEYDAELASCARAVIVIDAPSTVSRYERDCFSRPLFDNLVY